MILVTGATGFVGRHLVARLMADGLPVRVLLPPSRLRRLPWDNPPDYVVGTVLDDEALFQAATGVHTIIHLENAQWWGRRRALERVEIVGTRNLITVARSARVGRIITLSHLGANPASGYTLLQVKGVVEDLVRGSGLAYTILRSGVIFGEEDAFINHLAMQLTAMPFVFLMPGRGEVVLHPIHIDDLIEALVRSLEAINTVDEVIEFGGPEYITLADLIRTVMRVTRIWRLVVPVPPYLLRWTTAFYGRVLPRSIITTQWLDLLATNRVAKLGNTFHYFGFRPRRLEDTLLTYMPGKRYFLRSWRYALRRRPRSI